MSEQVELVDEIMNRMPESWGADADAESIVVDYVREIERRLVALGGTLERTGVVGSSSVADRRAEAREAFWAAQDDRNTATVAIRDALTVATQVRITTGAVNAFGAGWHSVVSSAPPGSRRLAGLAAALTELGFEVVP